MGDGLREVTRREREGLADSLLAAGAGAPTLCTGWDALDLASHLVVRERRPDLALGLAVPPLRGLLERATAAERARGLEAVVARFRAGPPPWSPFALPGMDVAGNLVELVVHHEDVRRPQGLGPRDDDALQEAVWRLLPVGAAVALARTSLPVVAVRPDGRRRVLRRGDHPVVLTGQPVELLLVLYGRRSAAEVQVGGPPLSVTRFEQARLGV